jgi:mono/diheme cytochrome c family protein
MKTRFTTIAGVTAVAAVSLAAVSIAAVSIASGTGAASPPDAKAQVAAAARTFGGTAAPDRVERGRYLVRTSGCNDCHTPHYMEKSGDVPERDWLTGVPVGFQGPWGTTYAANLRLTLNAMSEAQWLERARKPMRPPMPWFNLRDMTDEDLIAIYAYVRAVGPSGAPAPAYTAPGDKVDTPYFVFVPQNLPAAQAKAH